MSNYAGLELHEACAAGDSDAVEECIKSGIDVNAQDSDWNDRTPLHWACMKGHGDIVLLLLENRADPNILMDNGWSSAHSAAETGHVSILRALVQYGADILKQDRYGDSPRKIAEIHGNRECSKHLLGLERQICEEIMRKMEEERLAVEAAAAAAELAAAESCHVGGNALDLIEEVGESNPGLHGSASEGSGKTVTLVEGTEITPCKSGPTGSILRRSISLVAAVGKSSGSSSVKNASSSGAKKSNSTKKPAKKP